MGTAIAIIIIIILVIILYNLIKPYTIKYDTTLFISGGLGSGKTLTQVKIATNLIRRKTIKWKFYNNIKRPTVNFFRKKHNKRVLKKNKGTTKPYLPKTLKPQLYSNIPILYKRSIFTKRKNREYALKLKPEHLILTEEMTQDCVVLIDELPQLVNQFNWDMEQVQHNLNEFITLFRHYYNGYLLCNAQSIQDVVVQIRRKGNIAIWCYDFKKHLFGLFYTIRMCDMYINDSITSTSSTFVEDNTRLHFGLFPPKDTYDTRCFSKRLENILHPLDKTAKYERFNSPKTNKILRMEEWSSPLDDTTTKQTKEAYENKYKKKG